MNTSLYPWWRIYQHMSMSISWYGVYIWYSWTSKYPYVWLLTFTIQPTNNLVQVGVFCRQSTNLLIICTELWHLPVMQGSPPALTISMCLAHPRVCSYHPGGMPEERGVKGAITRWQWRSRRLNCCHEMSWAVLAGVFVTKLKPPGLSFNVD